MIGDSLPSFWTPYLSKTYHDINPIIQIIVPNTISKEEKMKKAKELRSQGLSFGQIVKILGDSKSTAKNYVDYYPYRKKC